MITPIANVINQERKLQFNMVGSISQEKQYGERGITLVSLIVTIIIIIILSTVTINVLLGDGGFISQAKLIKDSAESSITRETDSLTNLIEHLNEVYGDKGEITYPDYEYVPDISDFVGKPAFESTTQLKDDDGDTMWVPGGFGIAEDSETEIDRGVVITDGTNEFVWTPVDNTRFLAMYNETSITLAKSEWGETATTTTVYSKLDDLYAGEPGSEFYREPDILINQDSGDASTSSNRGINLLKSELGYTGTEAQILKAFAEDMVEEYKNVYESIKMFDGFYVGRYELTGSVSKPTVARNQPVLNASSSSANTWYGLKDACNRVVTGEDKDAQTNMIFGIQWEEVLHWLEATKAKTRNEIYTDSSSWGNYNNSTGNAAQGKGTPRNSAYNEAWCANKIYDLARKFC